MCAHLHMHTQLHGGHMVLAMIITGHTQLQLIQKLPVNTSVYWRSFPNTKILKNDIKYVCHSHFSCDVAQGLQGTSQLFRCKHQFLVTSAQTYRVV